MRHALTIHPDSRCEAVQAIEVDVARMRSGLLRLGYRAIGTMAGVEIAEPSFPGRSDRLWEHTCFEIFLRRPGDAGYVEFNFSPAGGWAAYRFLSQRRGMSNLPEFEDIGFAARYDPEVLALEVDLELGRLAHLIGDGPWSVGLSTIIEEVGGRKSYWALAHPEGKADFHDPASFALTIEPVTGT